MKFSRAFTICVLFCGLMALTGCPGNEPVCGDGVCDKSGGETHASCPMDCPYMPYCGDGTCGSNETHENCPDDCQAAPVCGDGTCNGAETQISCPSDCGSPPICGDGICNGGETSSSCPGDCPADNCPGPGVDCHDGSNVCWPDGTNCASNWFVCGGQDWRCVNQSDFAACCNNVFVTCPATNPYFCPQDNLCYAGGTVPTYCNPNVCTFVVGDC